MWQCRAGIAFVLGWAGCASDNDNTPARCGNEILDADEVCDGALIDDSFMCSDGQHPTGCNACVPECPSSSTCGNATIDEGEACDGANVPACPAGTIGEVTCSVECQADTSACVPSGGGVIVHVVEGTVDHAGVYVVSHMPDGTPITECTTNAAGLCVFSGVPADAMITIAYGRNMGPSLSTKYVTTYTHVTPPQTIEYVIPAPLPSETPTAASVSMPGPYTGAARTWSVNGCTEQEHTDFTTVHDHAFWYACRDVNQQGGVYAEARDDSGAAHAWSYQRKLVSGTTTFTLPAWSASFSMLTTEITNVPTVDKPLALTCNVRLDDLVPLTRARTAYPPAATETFAMAVPSALTTSARCSVSLGRGSQEGAQYCEQRQTPPFTNFMFDANDLLPQLTSTFATPSSVPAIGWTCTLSSQPTPTGDVSQCFKGFSNSGTPTMLLGWHLIAPGNLVGTLKAPTLGPSAPFSLTNLIAVPSNQQARRYAYSDVTSYSDYLDGRVEPATGTTCAVFHSHL